MNKQHLASTIWQSANQMRSKIEANEYKDYILGFMFYKYLSDREISFLKGEKYSDEDIKKVTADDEKLVKHISENIGYFIAYEDLFSSWLSKGDDFDVSEKPTGEEQGGGKYCDQHMSGEDCGYGTYFLPIEKNGVYLAIYYSF